MGAGKSTALAAARDAGLETTEVDELMERELGMPIAEVFEREARRSSARREARGRRRAARARRRRRDRARRRQRARRSGCARRSPATSSSGCRSTPTRPGGGSRGTERPLARPAPAVRGAAAPSALPLYEALADASCCRRPTASSSRGRCRAIQRAALGCRTAPGWLWARSGLRRVPDLRRRWPARCRLVAARGTSASAITDSTVGRALR